MQCKILEVNASNLESVGDEQMHWIKFKVSYGQFMITVSSNNFQAISIQILGGFQSSPVLKRLIF